MPSRFYGSKILNPSINQYLASFVGIHGQESLSGDRSQYVLENVKTAFAEGVPVERLDCFGWDCEQFMPEQIPQDEQESTILDACSPDEVRKLPRSA
jgi:hypothetical protein